MKVKLGDIAVFINGDRGKNYPSQADIVPEGEIPFVNAGHLTGQEVNFDDMNYISREKYDSLNSGKFCKGDILYCLRGSLGKKALVRESTEGAIASSLVIIRINKEIVDSEYLMFALDSPSIIEQLTKANNGSSQPNLSAASVKQYEIDLPNKETQIKVVNRLLKIRNIIDARKQQLQQLDELVKARFVEMFGDPVNNSKGLPELTLPELGEFGRGVSKHRPRNDPQLLGGKYPLIQTGEVANSELYITSFENTYSEHGLKQSKMWQSGTLCITIAANIAKTAILTFDACFPDSVVGFKANEKTNNVFIHYWFSFFQAILEAQAPESAQKNINLKILSELKIIVPPIEQQNKFVAFVEQTNKSKFAVQKALDEAQTLFDSLMQEYFG